MRIDVPPSARLDRWLPHAPFRDTIAIRTSASPEAAMRAAHEVTLRDMPIADVVGTIRYLPSSREARERQRSFDRGGSFLDQVVRGPGSLVLEDTPLELVSAQIAKLHSIRDQVPARVASADELVSFSEPGYEKLVMSLRAIADREGTILALEHRTQPSDPDAERRFARYWILIRPGGAFVTRQLLRAIARRAERAGIEGAIETT